MGVIRESLDNLYTPGAFESDLPCTINFSIYSLWHLLSLFTYIDLNFKKENFLPFSPILSCLKRTGPSDDSLMAIAIIRKAGRRNIRASKLPLKSIIFFKIDFACFEMPGFERSGYKAVLNNPSLILELSIVSGNA